MKTYKEIYDEYNYRCASEDDIEDVCANFILFDDCEDNFKRYYFEELVLDLANDMFKENSKSVTRTYDLKDLFNDDFKIEDEDLRYTALKTGWIIDDMLYDNGYKYAVSFSRDYKKLRLTLVNYNPNEIVKLTKNNLKLELFFTFTLVAILVFICSFIISNTRM